MNTRQWLVRLEGKTYVVDGYDCNESSVLSLLSVQSGWPVKRLRLVSPLTQSSYPFASARVISSILGGKGGFGTLLKGQSKQAGANLTTDFGACRDLQGRRLRHVNDEIKLRKWREVQRRKASGEKVDEAAEYGNTASGIYNWHLMVPNWSDISNKAKRKMQRDAQRQFEWIATEKEKRQRAHQEREEQHNQAVQAYVQETTRATQRLDVMDAVRQGLAANKRRREEASFAATEVTDEEDPEHNLEQQSVVTVSGDFVVEEKESVYNIQSKSDFATMMFVLDGKQPDVPLYYEIFLETGGLAQVGWAELPGFQPNTETGDGVGDDALSFAFDGSRSMKFHHGKETQYGKVWKAGDTLGCLFDAVSGTISYTLNGTSLGVAFTTTPKRRLVPAMSSNRNEILQLRTQTSVMRSTPKESFVAVGALSADSAEASKSADSETADSQTAMSKAVEKKQDLQTKPPPSKKSRPAPSKPEPYNLSKVSSAKELEALGMERLKSALMAVGVKCGGSLEERATRLYSLKGLDRKDYPKKVRAKNFVL